MPLTKDSLVPTMTNPSLLTHFPDSCSYPELDKRKLLLMYEDESNSPPAARKVPRSTFTPELVTRNARLKSSEEPPSNFIVPTTVDPSPLTNSA